MFRVNYLKLDYVIFVNYKLKIQVNYCYVLEVINVLFNYLMFME